MPASGMGPLAELFQGRFRKAGIFVVGLGFLVQITGFNAIVYILAPETKGRPLEEIRTYLYNGGSWPEEPST